MHDWTGVSRDGTERTSPPTDREIALGAIRAVACDEQAEPRDRLDAATMLLEEGSQ